MDAAAGGGAHVGHVTLTGVHPINATSVQNHLPKLIREVTISTLERAVRAGSGGLDYGNERLQ